MKLLHLTSVLLLVSLLNLNAGTLPPVKPKTGKNPAGASMAEMTKNIEFGFNKAIIKEEYYLQLDNLAKTLTQTNKPLVLRGYADSRGTYVANWKISDKRANAIRDYLINKGISGDNIVASPFGSNHPIANNSTAHGRQKNRRVEILVK